MKRTYHEVLEESIPSLKVYVRSSRQVRGLLKEHRFFPEYFANVDGDFLKDIRQQNYTNGLVGLDSTAYQFLSRKDRVHDGNVGCR
jgi:DNA-dependent RNA polymerase auxiliary subunit epsilon